MLSLLDYLLTYLPTPPVSYERPYLLAYIQTSLPPSPPRRRRRRCAQAQPAALAACAGLVNFLCGTLLPTLPMDPAASNSRSGWHFGEAFFVVIFVCLFVSSLVLFSIQFFFGFSERSGGRGAGGAGALGWSRIPEESMVGSTG